MAQKNQLVNVSINNASALVGMKDYRGAEAELQAIAAADGDKALVKALALVPSADLSQILLATATQPSAICAGLVSPRVFVKSLLEVPKTWLRYGEDSARLQLQELFCGVVMRPDQDGFMGYHASRFLKEIAKNELATELLAFYLSDKIFIITESNNPDLDGITSLHPCLTDNEYEPQEGDWDHLAFLTRKAPDLLSSIRILWHEGIPYDRFFPSITMTSMAVKSAL